jgi:hypothetical protein
MPTRRLEEGRPRPGAGSPSARRSGSYVLLSGLALWHQEPGHSVVLSADDSGRSLALGPLRRPPRQPRSALQVALALAEPPRSLNRRRNDPRRRRLSRSPASSAFSGLSLMAGQPAGHPRIRRLLLRRRTARAGTIIRTALKLRHRRVRVLGTLGPKTPGTPVRTVH